MANKQAHTPAKSGNKSDVHSDTKSGDKASSPDAIQLLETDHAAVKKLFKEFEKTDDKRRKQEIATTICAELTVHATIEEEIFYPAARAAIDEGDLLDEAEVEHASAKDLIAQIEAGAPGEELWEAKVIVLGEYIDHHVKEEEDEMFPKVKKSDIDLEALGEELQARKDVLKANPQARKPQSSKDARPTRPN
ncbi:MAG TPA: hemerythrin domain-containing protein [Steroidobacteraceae bacterium]|nr:hemerythrin domain-containing protein [Steroidobacteraceae bacterium]